MPHAIIALLLLVAAGSLQAVGQPDPRGAREGGDPGFVPAALYQYETVELANGFRAVLNPRGIGRNVSFRLVVDVGLLDFDCRDRELPHIAEHLMFSGYDDLTESDLDAMVSALGGDWNAFTHSYKTEYQLDIYSGHALEGLDILRRMFAGTVVTEERLASARGVVHAESGGEPGLIRDVVHRWGLGEAAVDDSYRRFVPASRAFCPGVPETDHLGVAELNDFLRTYYQPKGMLLIAVGDFDPAVLRQALEAGFGALPSTGAARPARVQPVLEPRAEHYRTTLNPLFGNTTQLTVDLFVGSPPPLGAEQFALQALAGYLDSRLYDEIRVARGLAYTPMASVVDQGDFMTLLLEAEVDATHADEVIRIMADIVGEVGSDGIDEETLEAQRQGSLYRLAADLDSNSSFSDIYVEVSDRLARGEPLPDIQAAIQAYDADAVRELARQRLSMDRALVYEAAPTLTYRTLGWLLVLLAAALVFGIWRFLVRRRHRGGSDPAAAVPQGVHDASD